VRRRPVGTNVSAVMHDIPRHGPESCNCEYGQTRLILFDALLERTYSGRCRPEAEGSLRGSRGLGERRGLQLHRAYKSAGPPVRDSACVGFLVSLIASVLLLASTIKLVITLLDRSSLSF
jgi:hypothetical protein